MRSKLVKTCCCILSILLLTVLTASCGKGSTEEGTTKEQAQEKQASADASQTEGTVAKEELKEVQLIMYLPGDYPRDADMVIEELNKKMKKDINATLKLNMVPFGDMRTKFPLLLASGEKFDLIFTATWCFFSEEGRKGAFMALDELLPKYAPQTWSETPQIAWEQAKINGKIYMIPQDYKEYTVHGAFIRGDLRKKYNVPEIKTMDDAALYLEAVKQNEKGMVPFNAGTGDLPILSKWLSYELDWSNVELAPMVNYKLNDASEAFCVVDTPEYEAFVKKMRVWAEKGFWSKNILSNQGASRDAFMNGKSAMTVLNLINANSFYQQVMDKYPEWDPEWYEFGPGTLAEQAPYITNGMAVYKDSPNPERALMLIELLRNDREYFDLTTYGIRGKHYELTEDGKLTLPEGVNAADVGFKPDEMAPWGWRVEKFYRSSANSWPLFDTFRADLEKRAIIPPLSTFTVNDENIKSEIAALNQVGKEFKTPLDWGMVDPESGLKALKQKLKEAGIDKVLDEINRQLKEAK